MEAMSKTIHTTVPAGILRGAGLSKIFMFVMLFPANTFDLKRRHL